MPISLIENNLPRETSRQIGYCTSPKPVSLMWFKGRRKDFQIKTFRVGYSLIFSP
ncbi:hypothetical protein F3B47_17815 [Bacteroides fragilis]|uniref:Uncharacterized protein n=1 Tax=Bacteroides uniformis TaxID=820 RepID=A0A6I0JR33_BACUN|nr:hypothetical protein F3B36_09000 [Bacteroides fragilis]KAB4118480.1 hypothetical protein GAQ75_23200 [Bacteroides uniformis]KAA4757676.1 hypothetical protein F3B47_17815 [Bacteroides fragilis]KAA4764373.1 hypothetical protein F3B24_10790 [Bacteroides fragilis]KAA4766513.1 hypothetical protein F3B25_06650 [Bacteroides fragilis]